MRISVEQHSHFYDDHVAPTVNEGVGGTND
jgi:hypothetical protein